MRMCNFISIISNGKRPHIPICLTAETMEAPVNLHAWVFVGMEGTDAHPVSSHPDSEMLGSLPGGNRLLDSFKYIQLNPPENKKSVCHSRKENGKRLLKFHILFFLCAGLLAFLALFLPDTLRPAFDCLLDGRFLARFGCLDVYKRQVVIIVLHGDVHAVPAARAASVVEEGKLERKAAVKVVEAVSYTHLAPGSLLWAVPYPVRQEAEGRLW